MEKKGKAVALAGTTEADEQVNGQEQRRQRFWQTVDQIRERNADQDPDEALAFITAVVEGVRQERHERAQGSQDGR